MLADLQFVGIDVSKERLDVRLHPSGKPLTVANTPAGFGSLKAKLQRLCIAAIGLEASGGYEKQAADFFATAGFVVYVLNPAQVRTFATSLKSEVLVSSQPEKSSEAAPSTNGRNPFLGN